MKKNVLWLLLTVLLATSCSERRQGPATGRGMAYASLLSMKDSDGVTSVVVSDPWQAGRTLQRIAVADGSSTNDPHTLRPLRRVVVFTTSHCQLLEYLHLQDRIVGVCDLQYILIPDIQRRVREGKIADCGSSMAPDMEKIVELHPDAIIVSPYEGNTGMEKLAKLGIPIIQAADYMETSALGRAEWMRYYGRLFGCGDRADSLFHVVDSTYHSLKAYAARLPRGRSVITERIAGTVWYMPGGRSTVAALIGDANGRYPFSDDSHSGSLTLSKEQVINKAADVDLWAFKVDGNRYMTKADLLRECEAYKVLRAFQRGDIYECNSSKIPYFEEVSWRPDYQLREFIQLLHPGVSLGGLRYYRKLSTKHT